MSKARLQIHQVNQRLSCKRGACTIWIAQFSMHDCTYLSYYKIDVMMAVREHVIAQLVSDKTQSFGLPLSNNHREQVAQFLSVAISFFFLLLFSFCLSFFFFIRTPNHGARIVWTHAPSFTQHARTIHRQTLLIGWRAGLVQCRNSGHEIFHDNAVRGPIARTVQSDKPDTYI